MKYYFRLCINENIIAICSLTLYKEYKMYSPVNDYFHLKNDRVSPSKHVNISD